MYHKIVLAGYVGRDPEMRYMPDGTGVTSFSVAVSDGWGDKKKTIWVRVSVWGKRAETANQYVTKGQRILVEGRLNADPNTGGPKTWTGQDGSVRASFEVTASDFTFLSGKDEQTGFAGESQASYGSNNSGGNASSGSTAMTVSDEDEIPF